jgi:hypothetical protein
MRIFKDTLNELSERGINVRWYPEATFEEFKKRVWQQEYDYAFNYGKGEVITFEQWLREKGEDSLNYPSSCEIKDIPFVDADKVNSINMDKPSLNQIGMCTLKIGTDMEGGDVTTDAHIDFI